MLVARRALAAAALGGALLVAAAGGARADDPGDATGLPDGVEIARRINARDEGTSLVQTLVMQLVDKRGGRRERETVAYRKYFGDEKRIAIFFEEPKSIEGTAFLTWDHPEPGRDDDQWLYLPALRKSRRIAAADRGAAFVGTDFSYEDVKKAGKVAIEDYRWTTTGEDSLDDRHCYVVEALPVDDETARELGYGRVVLWVDSEIWMIRKAEYWDRALERLKTVQSQGIRPVGGIWTAHRIEAYNHQTGHTTVFTFADVAYDEELSDDVFTENALKRGPPRRP